MIKCAERVQESISMCLPVCTSKYLLDKSYVTGNAPANKDIKDVAGGHTHKHH